MSNSHAACQPLSLICLGWVKGSLVVKSEPALRGLLVKLLHPPLHQRSSWGLYPVLPQREGTGFSQGLILLSKWLYCIIRISEEKWTSTWPGHIPGKLNTALPTLVRHQTSLHEILRQYIIGGPWWRRAGQGWGECLSVHAWVCTMNNSSSQEKKIHVINTCWVPTVFSWAPMPALRMKLWTTETQPQPLKGQTSQFSPDKTDLTFSSVSSKPKALILKIHSLKSYLSKTQEVWFGPLWNSIGR